MDESVKLRIPAELVFTSENKETVVEAFSSELSLNSIIVETIGPVNEIQPRVNDEVTVKFVTPFGRDKIEIRGKVKWIKTENSNLLVFLSFLDSSSEAREEIERYIVSKIKTSKKERRVYSHSEYIERISKFLELTKKTDSNLKETVAYGIKILPWEFDIFMGRKDLFADKEAQLIKQCVALRLKLKEIERSDPNIFPLLKDDYEGVVEPLIASNVKELEGLISSGIKSSKGEKIQKFKNSLAETMAHSKDVSKILYKQKVEEVKKNQNKIDKKDAKKKPKSNIQRFDLDESKIKLLILVLAITIIVAINLGRIISCNDEHGNTSTTYEQ